jgi:hypothetical protein
MAPALQDHYVLYLSDEYLDNAPSLPDLNEGSPKHYQTPLRPRFTSREVSRDVTYHHEHIKMAHFPPLPVTPSSFSHYINTPTKRHA